MHVHRVGRDVGGQLVHVDVAGGAEPLVGVVVGDRAQRVGVQPERQDEIGARGDGAAQRGLLPGGRLGLDDLPGDPHRLLRGVEPADGGVDVGVVALGPRRDQETVKASGSACSDPPPPDGEPHPASSTSAAASEPVRATPLLRFADGVVRGIASSGGGGVGVVGPGSVRLRLRWNNARIRSRRPACRPTATSATSAATWGGTARGWAGRRWRSAAGRTPRRRDRTGRPRGAARARC